MSNQAERNSVVQHTPEPWSFASTRDQSTYALFDSSGRVMAMFLVGGVFSTQDEIMQQHRQNKVDARRIVACVNACAGIDIESLEADGYGDNWAEIAKHRIELMGQRDELLVALKDAVETIEWMYGCSSPASDEIEKSISEGNAVIAKAEGGAV